MKVYIVLEEIEDFSEEMVISDVFDTLFKAEGHVENYKKDPKNLIWKDKDFEIQEWEIK